jgi:dolichol-phosphate mannosyltransferase
VPTLNEVQRLSPCLSGLSQQSYELQQIVIVDSNSQDGTQELVQAAQAKEPRLKLITDPPLPTDWVGRTWALHQGFLYLNQQAAPVDWFLGIDADTQPQPGLVASLLQVAESENYDLISLSPQFILKYPGEWWLQPALLMTLLFRFDPAGINPDSPETVMANGQCFLCRREVLEKVAGYSTAKNSFCDDVTLARYIAAQGFKVGFLDGGKVIKVRMYEGMAETWTEWGRSLALKDASSPSKLFQDCWLLLAVQGLPLLSVMIGSLMPTESLVIQIWLALNWFLVIIRVALLAAIAPSYDWTKTPPLYGLFFLLSPLADPLAFVRIIISALSRPKRWRGRDYI